MTEEEKLINAVSNISEIPPEVKRLIKMLQEKITKRNKLIRELREQVKNN